jgi:hypothetical protein
MVRRAVVVSALVVVACTAGVQTSVPGNTPVSSLSAEQTQQLCRDRRRYVEGQFTEPQRKTLTCNLVGVLSGSLASAFGGADAGVAACQMTFDDCQSKPLGTADGGTSDSCATVMPLMGCAATVADYNSCFVDRYEQLRPWTQTSQCPSLTNAADAGVPTSCERIASSCMAATGQLSW